MKIVSKVFVNVFLPSELPFEFVKGIAYRIQISKPCIPKIDSRCVAIPISE